MFVVNRSKIGANFNDMDALTLDLSIAFGAGPEDVPVSRNSVHKVSYENGALQPWRVKLRDPGTNSVHNITST